MRADHEYSCQTSRATCTTSWTPSEQGGPTELCMVVTAGFAAASGWIARGHGGPVHAGRGARGSLPPPASRDPQGHQGTDVVMIPPHWSGA